MLKTEHKSPASLYWSYPIEADELAHHFAPIAPFDKISLRFVDTPSQLLLQPSHTIPTSYPLLKAGYWRKTPGQLGGTEAQEWSLVVFSIPSGVKKEWIASLLRSGGIRQIRNWFTAEHEAEWYTGRKSFIVSFDSQQSILITNDRCEK